MNPLRLFRRQVSGRSTAHSPARMTWASESLSRSLSRTGVLLRKNIWIWPVIAVVLLSIIGVSVKSAIESTMKENLHSQLQTLLNTQTAMLETWFQVQCSNAETAANDLTFREEAYQLLGVSEEGVSTVAAAVDNSVNEALERALSPMMSSQDFVGFFVADRQARIVASSHSVLIGQQEVASYSPFLNRALDGKTVVSPPFPSVVMIRNDFGQVRTGEPTMYVCAPIRDRQFQVVGALALQLRPDRKFTHILQLGRIGNSGETYAFDSTGTMVSNSRFDNELILLGILPDREDSRSILQVQIRDPLGNMTKGYRPDRRRSEMPLTKMAANAVDGVPGVDVDGYRDYRGVLVVGAWTWLPEYQIGIATELDVDEAFRALTILKTTFWILYALLIASSIAIFVFTVIVARLQREARKAAIEAQQLGQYTLEEELGAGGMGVVYRGRHAMLRRPTAIKLLNAEKIDDESIQRFEREVQITCQLNHPSTVQIYDYGRTPEGVFYYAMEYLDGIDLQTLVERYGPQPGGRVVYILQQACGSLFEAHSQGLVHRDIKPSNIMVNRRGGESDVVKVLDFGLVKTIDDEKQTSRQKSGGLTGTPLYMSPEAIQSPMSVDARSDLYALGAVGYFLLTGHPVFEAGNLSELCQMHVDATPVAPSKRLGKHVSEELEDALLSCLEKSRAKRPATTRDLAHRLKVCPEAAEWSMEKADAWWGRHDRGQSGEEQGERPPSSQGGYDQTYVLDSE